MTMAASEERGLFIHRGRTDLAWALTGHGNCKKRMCSIVRVHTSLTK